MNNSNLAQRQIKSHCTTYSTRLAAESIFAIAPRPFLEEAIAAITFFPLVFR
ncbi:hypothetical protein I8748_20010 [Nostoc sp. CENA67]|uniref:Uncharacterized protein n=1 Tax=Amazonocrinis nigriterrae CENA67 TaxID=2794033 RepID=A0A8J7L8G0_9NOST|nr:hypothetical protein [Amazonocrinis nigriterrae]MBH8564439.1 hypothetical protein [Amazonocrinis nigriterrae CENA67]